MTENSDAVTSTAVVDEITDTFAAIGVTGRLHALSLTTDREVGADPDTPVVLASVVKVLIALEYARQATAGLLDPTSMVWVRDGDRLGGTGTAGFLDDVALSLRDLAGSMMSVSDNTAADLLLDRIGLAALRSAIGELGLGATTVLGAPRDILATIIEDVGADDDAEFAIRFAAAAHGDGRRVRAFDPAGTTSSTPRDMTRLLSLIWRDLAGSAAACAEVRRLMSAQLNWHRLAAGFDDEVLVAAKSGSLPPIRNEIGVITYPDGRGYAVSVFVELTGMPGRRPDVDVAIGRAARLAVDWLRATDDASASPG
ncbi:serine hydrolase [Actinoalloteichus hymeniacidonis]|uniref:Beta-lactamase class A n=1 Tax=Actinoalloteichus hymeniacidonis TaxID=340345 RepID=A0AAC9HV94_9PSEU|nr:serine hydrolase [Actinoalloteichus hymeniacidonis]AOS66093.1 beta-lactamase class A [Actinoalloteichus hymeniacidonis]MBB5905803.1 beta-lactamase class A [Actinoalloteichus hymeniacidonis]